MKSLGAVAILFLAAVTSRGQLTLNPGDTWFYQFESLPFVGTSLFGPPNYAPPSGGGGFNYNIVMEPGSALRVEQFEEAPTGAPLFSVVRTSAEGTNFPGALFSWNDLDGSIRFTMLSGSATIASFRLFNWHFTGSAMFSGYEATVVPQPLAPTLRIDHFASSVELSWWTNGAGGFQLEATNTLTGLSWTPVSDVPTVITGRNHVTLGSTGAMQFFRLKK